MILMVPTTIYVHLRLPKVRRVVEFITILPIVIPPIILITGVLGSYPLWLKSSPYLLSLMYVILAMPFVYRSLDAGLNALDLKTLVEASRSLGAGWISTMRRVLMPNLRSALLSAGVLTAALVLGEFTIATFMSRPAFAPYLNIVGDSKPYEQAALALVTLTEQRNAATLDLIRERALPALVDMARWKTLGYALPAFLLVGRTAGVPEEELREQWQQGDRETAIEKATAPAPKVRRGK